MAELKEFLDQIKSNDVNVSYQASTTAGPMGAQAVMPLAEVMKLDIRTNGRAATLALQNIVHHAARPGAQTEARAVAEELLRVAAVPTQPRAVRGNCLYLVGFIGSPEAIPALVKLLDDRVIREDARMALERIPGDESLGALRKAAETAPADFRKNLQQSLHNRGLTYSTAGVASAI